MKASFPHLVLVVTAALLSACASSPADSSVILQAQAAAASTMKTAEASGRIAAWASGRIAAWASGMQVSTVPDGSFNTFGENLAAWKQIHLAEGQALAPRLGQDVVVAVVDTGIDPTHPAFAGHLTPAATWYDYVSRDPDPTDVPTARNVSYGHGTAVAGLILQVAPNAKIMPIRALDADGSGSSAGLADAVNWAASHGAQIINVSAVAGVDTVLTTALTNAAARGIYVSIAAGNDGVNHLSYPGRFTVQDGALGQYGINAGAVNTDNTLASWSNYGQNLELSAPGVGLATAIPGGSYALASGTSFAAPIVSGSLALALAEGYKKTFAGRLALQLDATGTSLDSANARLLRGNSRPLGNGLLNVQAFMQSIR